MQPDKFWIEHEAQRRGLVKQLRVALAHLYHCGDQWFAMRRDEHRRACQLDAVERGIECVARVILGFSDLWQRFFCTGGSKSRLVRPALRVRSLIEQALVAARHVTLSAGDGPRVRGAFG